MDLPRLLAQLDDALLGELFSASSLSRARTYVGRVRHIEMGSNSSYSHFSPWMAIGCAPRSES